jgi:hypothetical protein
LPDLHQLTGHRPAVAVQDPPGDHDPFPDRLPVVLDRQVRLERIDVLVSEHRREQFDGLGVRVLQVLGGVTQDAAAVGRVVQPRLGLEPGRSRPGRVFEGDCRDLIADR